MCMDTNLDPPLQTVTDIANETSQAVIDTLTSPFAPSLDRHINNSFSRLSQTVSDTSISALPDHRQ
jgi:hypothetical protein